jgi:hypothetical protein
MSSARVIDFEEINPTSTFPFTDTPPGGLVELELFGGTLSRGVGRFDIVDNVDTNTKPPEYGQNSLDPFFIEDTTPFRFDIDSGTGERDFFFANTVSITAGDYGGDADTIVLQAFSDTDVLLGEATATLPGGGTDFTSTTLTVTSQYGEQISYIKFIGGNTENPNTVYYDNITLTYVPTENELTNSNPYWNGDIEEVTDELVDNLLIDALTGKGEKFVYLIPSGGDNDLEPTTQFQRENRDEATTQATEAYKIGSKEWIEQVQNYLDENYPAVAPLFGAAQLTGISWNLFIAAI